MPRPAAERQVLAAFIGVLYLRVEAVAGCAQLLGSFPYVAPIGTVRHHSEF